MRHQIKLLVVSLAVAAPLAVQASEWSIDPSHSASGFVVRHMMVSNVRGEFGKTSGTVVLDDADVTKSTVNATIDASTINTREPKRDAHLRSPDFFDVAKFPSITFKSTAVKKAGKDHLTVAGELTMHGVSRPVSLDVTLSAEQKSPFGDTRRGATASTKINRKDFGLNWNKALEAGGVLVGEEVSVVLDVELVKQTSAGKPASP
jgi:polyisoprenoid-binding protein YceI